MESLNSSRDLEQRSFPEINVRTIREHPYFEPGHKRLVEYYRRRGLKNDMDVYLLTKIGLVDPIIGTRKNCNADDHTAPFSFVADVLLNRVQNYIVWANRAGSKSYLAGLITWVRSSFLSKMETSILGGSLEQSEKSYKAMGDFWKTTDMIDEYLVGEPIRMRTVWKNGSVASVLTASQKSVRGPHPQSLIQDEIDEMDEDVYMAALSQPQSKHGIPASLGRLSTNHKLGGVMDTALEKALESGTSIYKWCIWECLESCKDYSCSTCKLGTYCPGQHMKKADGYYPISDFIQKLYELSEISLQVEWFCVKVGRDDLVYGAQYDEELHSPMSLPGVNLELPVYLSIDWGGTNPFSVGVWQNVKGLGWVRADEIYQGHTTNQRLLNKLKELPWWKNVKEGVADPSRPDLIQEWKDAKVHVYKARNDIEPGIEAMRNALAPVLGNPRIFINRKCKAWRTEVKAYYEKNGTPVDELNHAMDETRYFVMRHIAKKKQVRIRRLT